MKAYLKVLILMVFIAAVIAGVLDLIKSSEYSFLASLNNIQRKQSEEVKDRPIFLSASIEPKKVAPGDNVIVTVEIKDDYGVTEVKADMGGIANIMLELIESDIKQGIWQGNWLAYDTKPQNYQTMVFATNAIGKQSSISINWEDPTITDTFNNEDYIASKSNTVVSSGQVELAGGGGDEANMILFWDGESIPDGWSLVSGDGGDFYQKLIRGAASYGGTGGNTTHTHTLTLQNCTGASAESAKYSDSGGTDAVTNHTHTLGTVACGSANNLPAYKSLKVIKYDSGIPTTLPAGVIAIFDSTLPSGWTRETTIDDKFIYCSDTVTTGGSDTHTHTISGTTAAVASSSAMAYSGGSIPHGWYGHSHTVNVSSDSYNSMPVYKTVLFAKKDSAGYIPLGLIAMFDASPSGGNWSVVSGSGQALNNYFLRGSASYGSTGGSNTHTPSNQVFTTNGQSYDTSELLSGTGIAIGGHTHNMTVSFTQGDNTPSYIDVIFAKAVYASSGNIVSTNLLTGQVVSSIDSFVYTVSDVPSGTGLKFQFSQDNTNWYNSAGTLNGWDTFSEVWVSPTGTNDPDSRWTSDSNVHDENTGSYASFGFLYSEAPIWGSFLEMTHAALMSSKIRYWPRTIVGSGGPIDQIDVDVYSGSSWVDVYQGSYTQNEWQTKGFTLQSITKARIRYHDEYELLDTCRIYEVDFWQSSHEIDLSGLGWSGPNFYYKAELTSDGSDTPVLDDISVNYSSWTPRPPAISPSGGGFLIF